MISAVMVLKQHSDVDLGGLTRVMQKILIGVFFNEDPLMLKLKDREESERENNFQELILGVPMPLYLQRS